MTTRDLFAGTSSLRTPHERTALSVTLVVLAIVLPLAGFLSEFLSWHSLAIVAVVGMVFVALSRGRLLGTSVRVHREQFPDVYEIVERCAHKLAMPVPNIFLRDDDVVAVAAVGIGEPYSIVLSTKYLRELQPDELAFVVGRELGHIAAGHTRYTSLLSINGRENPLISIAFGVWLRKLEYTADRVGLLLGGSLDAAHRAIAVTTFHRLGRTVDLRQFAEQRNDLQREPSLRMGEWLASTPYAVHRMAALDAFAQTPLAAEWRTHLERGIERPVIASDPTDAALERTGYAGFWRRAAAFSIDAMLCAAILPSIENARVERTVPDAVAELSPEEKAKIPAATLKAMQHLDKVHVAFDPTLFIVSGCIAVYVVVLVALLGQTFGMLVMDMRVVDERLQRIGPLRAIGRYLCLIASCFFVYPLFRIFGRVQPFEKWSGTRLVQARALEERRAAAGAFTNGFTP